MRRLGPFAPDGRLTKTGWTIAAVGCFILLLSRVWELRIPTVFGDEYSYAAWAYYIFHRNAQPDLAPVLNNWLFSLLASVIHIGSDHTIQKARLLNAVIVFCTLWPLYRLATLTFRGPWAILIALAFVWGGLGGYMAYLMPESLYFALYAGLIAALMLYLRTPTLSRLVGAAVVHALLVSTKPHGLFILPAFTMAVALYDPTRARIRVHSRGIGAAFLYAATAYLLSCTINSIISGSFIANPFSGFYGSQSSRLSDMEYVRSLLEKMSVVGLKQLAFALTLFSLPLLVVVVSATRNLFEPRRDEDPAAAVIRGGSLFVLAGYLSLLAITVLFSAMVAGTGPEESLTRMHGRYYEVALIMLIFHSLLVLAKEATHWKALWRWIAAVIVVASSAGGYMLIMTAGEQRVYDFALGYAAYSFPFVRYNSMLAALAAAAVFAIRPRFAAQAVFVGFLVYLLWAVDKVDDNRSWADSVAVDRYGKKMRRQAEGGNNSYVFFDAYDPNTYRAAFYMIGRGEMIRVSGGQPPLCEKIKEPALVLTLHDIGTVCGLTLVARDDNMRVSLLSTDPHAKPANP